jgi:parvulin-like peptidyl-prolyl isomerase
MRKRIVLLALAALGLSACGNLLQPAAATVGDEKITIHEIEKSVDEYERSDQFQKAADQGDPQTLRRAFEQQELSRLILVAVLEPEAEELGLEVTDEDVEEEIDRIVEEDFGGNQAAFEERLKEGGIRLADLNDLAYARLLEQRVKNSVTEDLTPSDEELRSFYEENPSRYVESEAAHIVVASRADAQRIAQTLQRTPPAQVEDRFSEIAREESVEASTAVSGGVLPVPYRPGDFDPAFEAAASQLAPGEVSGPVQTAQGWEVIRLIDRNRIEFDRVRDEIIEQLAGEKRDEQWLEWLQAKYEEVEVEVNPRFGELNPETFTVENAPTSDIPGTGEVETPSPTPPGG